MRVVSPSLVSLCTLQTHVTSAVVPDILRENAPVLDSEAGVLTVVDVIHVGRPVIWLVIALVVGVAVDRVVALVTGTVLSVLYLDTLV